MKNQLEVQDTYPGDSTAYDSSVTHTASPHVPRIAVSSMEQLIY